jgi:hypothetical protein
MIFRLSQLSSIYDMLSQVRSCSGQGMLVHARHV